MSYLSQIRSGGKQYIYLTEYCGTQPYSTKTEKHIFSFGCSQMALVKMKRWFRKFESEFPDELKRKGYSIDDLKMWIQTLETGFTKNGRKFNFEKKKREVF